MHGDFEKAKKNFNRKFPQEILNRAGLIHEPAPLNDQHLSIVTGLLNTSGNAVSLRDVALSSSLADLTELATVPQKSREVDQKTPLKEGDGVHSEKSPEGAPSSGPTFQTADVTEDPKAVARKEALFFRQKLFQSHPTAALQRMVVGDELGSFPNKRVRDGVITFFSNQPPSFSIRKDPLFPALSEPESFRGIHVS